MTNTFQCRPPRRLRPQASHQRGVVLIFALVALTVMLIGAAALISSFNNSLTSAGNIGFKRDLQNLGERAADNVYAQFVGTVLKTPALRADTKALYNYSAVVLPTNPQGIPTDLLLKQSAFAAKWTGADIDAATQKTTVRYLVDRLCRGGPAATTTEGKIAQAAGPDACVVAPETQVAEGGDESHLQGKRSEVADEVKGIGGGVQVPAVYRITVRVMGPRGTEAYYQTTFAEPL